MFANTPDILHEYLQVGGRPAFEARLVLAATLSPTLRHLLRLRERARTCRCSEGSEEYLDSEKYEIKRRRLDGPLLPLVRRLNEIRRATPALQHFDDFTFVETHNEHLFAFAKEEEASRVIVVVNLDPFADARALAIVPASLGFPPQFAGEELLTGDAVPLADRAELRPARPGQSHIVPGAVR